MSLSSPLRLVPSQERALVKDHGAFREAQRAWRQTSLRQRLKVIREVRHRIAENAEAFADLIRLPQRSSRAETLAAEVLPLADACRFLEREARSLLAPRRPGRRGRPFWLQGSEIELRRESLGLILVIGPSNYPLLLPGVQLLQALVAGNAVLVKPGRHGSDPLFLLAHLLRQSGLPERLLTILDESPDAAHQAIDAGVDKVLVTGSVETGRAVQELLVPGMVPSVMELSGCDPVFVREDADLDLVTRALRFGMTFNGSFTCIAPRRVFVAKERAVELEERLVKELAAVEPIAMRPETAREVRRLAEDALAAGARLVSGEVPKSLSMRPLILAETTPAMAVQRADIAAPMLSLCAVEDDSEALELVGYCPYELGATVFGAASGSEELATRVDAGVVVVNDLIVPTADPRVPFGGAGASGFGVTRGAEGLLELTRVKTVITRRGSFRPHFDPPGPEQEGLMSAFVRIAHSRTFGGRLKAMVDAARILARRPSRTARPEDSSQDARSRGANREVNHA